MTGAARPVLAWATVMACACAASGGLDRVPDGQWGGEHVALTVEAAGARVELDCAHGASTASLKLDAKGAFDVPGYFVQEHGGPEAEDPQAEERPARYAGTSDGRTIRFTIRLTEDGTTLGPFEASLGEPARLFKCLIHSDP